MYTPPKGSLNLVSALLSPLSGHQKIMTPNNNSVKRRHTLRLFYKRRLYKKAVAEILLLLLLLQTALFLLCVMLVFNILGQKI